MVETRVCVTCGEELPITEFYKNGRNKDGSPKRRADCRTCYKIKRKINNKKHNKFKNNTKNRHGDVEVLSLDEWKDALIHWRGSCAYCGRTPRSKGHGLTKEHVIPLSKGGSSTKENIIPVCVRCNCSKSNEDLMEWYPRQKFFSQERLEKIQKWLKEWTGGDA